MLALNIEDLPTFIVGKQNLSNIRNAGDCVLMDDSQGKLQEILDKVVTESSNKGVLTQ